MKPIPIEIKPLSANEMWKGRRFKSDLYKSFDIAAAILLPRKLEIPEGKLEIHFDFYFNSSQCDWDNPIKSCQDVICKKYKINDNRIYYGTGRKHIVPKGKERIEFRIEALKC
jgi:Holliday junction resolvase RusA-like endonuclease